MRRQAGSSNRTVLVLGADTRSFLSVVRSLGRYGILVDAAWVKPESPARQSRFLRSVHEIPTPWNSPDNWVKSFNDLLRDKNYDLVVPCNDPSTIPLQQSRKALINADRICLLDEEVFTITQSKVLSTQLAASLDVPVPKHVVASTIESGLEFANTVGYPVVLKPTESYRPSQLLRKQAVVRVHTEQEMTSVLGPMLSSGVVQVQANFEGIGTGVEFLAKEGKLCFAFQHVRLHEPIDGGGSSYRSAIELHPAMLAATCRIIRQLGYSGVGMVEFLWNTQQNTWMFVEINGRFWGSLPLAIASRADFPKFLFQSRVEGKSVFPQNYKLGLCCRNWAQDKDWYLQRLSTTQSRVAICRLFAVELAQAVWRIITFRERSDTLTLDDPRPGLLETSTIASNAVLGIGRRSRSRIDHLQLTKSIQRHRITKRFIAAAKILFVCKGNICRSPFASAYLKSIFSSDKEIDSCGYYPVADRSCPAPAIEVAQEFGLDLTQHHSKVIDDALAQRSDLIFVFDRENREAILTRFPGCHGKVHYLGNFLSDGIYIKDPFGGSGSQFLAVYEKIRHALNQCLKNVATAPFESVRE